MKKVISALTAAALAASIGVSAFADGFVNSMNTVDDRISGGSEDISIIYNGQLMSYTDAAPENINDRVMLPFRAVLEEMGADVDYDEATRLVTASKGDTTIKFTVLDDTIYITKDGKNTELKLDVPMVIKNDRTLVPIRFISNALGMQVGWDGDYKTVLIVDSEAYADDVDKNTPNFTALMEKAAQKYNTDTIDMTVDVTPADAEEFLSLALKLDSVTADNSASLKGTINADIGPLDLSTAENADIEMITADGKLYFKTDLFEKLSAGDNNSFLAGMLKTAVDGAKWYYVDIETFVEKLLGDNVHTGIKNIYIKALSGDFSSLNSYTLSEIIKEMTASDGDATIISAMEADIAASAYKALDKYITVTDSKIEMKIGLNEFLDILDAIGLNDILSDEALKDITENLTFDVDVVTEYGENEAVSKVDMNIGLKDDVSFKFSVNETSKQDDNAAPAAVPADAVDFTPVFESLPNLIPAAE